MFDQDNKVKYQSFSSILNPGFWQQLQNIKLNKLKLSKEPVDIHGSYACNLSPMLPCLASFDHNSFNENTESNNKSECTLYGQVICTNILQEFLDYNKREFLDRHGLEIWAAIYDARALLNPEKYLSKFGLLVYGDLKKYKFFYWFSFPAVNYPKEVELIQDNRLFRDKQATVVPGLHQPILDYFNEDALAELQSEYDKPSSERSFQRGYFIVKHFKKAGTERVSVFPLSQYKEIVQQSNENEKDCTIYFAYTDASSSRKYPGWSLRNYLCLIAVQFQLDQVNIIRIRRGQPSSSGSLAKRDAANQCKIELHHSLVLEVKYQLDSKYNPTEEKLLPETPLITGWEKNESQQIAPKCVNLAGLLDPKKLAEDAVNLNLRLMKWRLLPTIDLERIANTKCLLLGCGTLGCHIARGLLAWGIKNISIVDNAKISYSNPVRQTLYTFDDCSDNSNSVFKAEAAAASLLKIHPSVNVKAHVLTIPMPGHHVADKEIEQTRSDVVTFENLIDSHDAIFLLMDTRESRWLPTVIAMSKQKLVINAAIGFDTFLLQRYGVRKYADFSGDQTILNSSPSDVAITESSTAMRGESSKRNKINHLSADKLGCYFCNDIVAPGDSTLDRTLDQQCTVSRPGVSMLVSALAVELLASVISSRLGSSTPAPLEIQNDHCLNEDEEYGSELGIVPHTIRGNLSRYYTYMPTTPAFNKCSACSPAVINAYKLSGYEFLQRVFEDPSYLEEVAGLRDLQNISDNVWALDSDEDADDFEETKNG